MTSDRLDPFDGPGNFGVREADDLHFATPFAPHDVAVLEERGFLGAEEELEANGIHFLS